MVITNHLEIIVAAYSAYSVPWLPGSGTEREHSDRVIWLLPRDLSRDMRAGIFGRLVDSQDTGYGLTTWVGYTIYMGSLSVFYQDGGGEGWRRGRRRRGGKERGDESHVAFRSLALKAVAARPCCALLVRREKPPRIPAEERL